MLKTLTLGILFTFALLALLWLGFNQLRKHPRFDHFNSRQANKRMLQLSLIIYFSGFILTIYFML